MTGSSLFSRNIHYYQIPVTMEENKNELLQCIANHLIINVGFLDNLGLYHGKTGIILFFVHYARFTGNPIYDEIAGELLDEIIEEIHDGIATDFENGLSGIGWGLLYLLKNKFMDGNPDEILEDIDKKLMEINLPRLTDFSIERGLAGISIYLSARLSAGNTVYPFDTEYLSNWQKAISGKNIEAELDLYSIINQGTATAVQELQKKSLGLQDGYAGLGLKLMEI